MFDFLRRWFGQKEGAYKPTYNYASPSPGFGYVDAWDTVRAPGQNDLLKEFEGQIYTLANLNAQAVMRVKPRVYIKQDSDSHGFKTRWSGKSASDYPTNRMQMGEGEELVEVTDPSHPLNKILKRPNEYQTGAEFFESTQLGQELQGLSYWLPTYNALGTVQELMFVPSQMVRPYRNDELGQIQYYEIDYKQYAPDQIWPIKMVNPMDPYGPSGVSPLRACWEHNNISNQLLALESALSRNQGRPDFVVAWKDGTAPSPLDIERFESSFNSKFRYGGNGRGAFIGSDVSVTPLNFTPKDMESLKLYETLKILLANAYQVPTPLIDNAQISRSNLETAVNQHAMQAIVPRLRRLEATLNDKLVPIFDPTGRTIILYDDPSTISKEIAIKEQESATKNAVSLVVGGVATPNEVRHSLLGLPPIEGGDQLVGHLVTNVAGEETNGEQTTDNEVESEGTGAEGGESGEQAAE